jgi:FHA domain-containing protein/zinc ribbon protein
LRVPSRPHRRIETRFEGDTRVYCTNCGHQNRDDARFCAKCGSPLETDATLRLTPLEVEDEPVDEFPFPHDELEPGQALLLVKELTTCGRSPESAVFLDDITVSRKHAEFQRRDGSFFVKDVGSLNGTYVNGEQVEETKLANGDEVQVGRFKLVFFSAGE